MQSKTQEYIEPAQPLPQVSAPTPAQQLTNYSKTLSFIGLVLVVVVVSVFAGIQIGKNQTLNQQKTVAQLTTSPTQLVATTTTAATPSSIIDSTANWKTYASAEYTLRYPAEWIVEEKCTKLGYPASNPCIYSSDYHAVTKKVEPGEGGVDSVTEYNVGTLLSIDLLDNVAYDPLGFCSPGGPDSIDNCHEKTISGNRYALREIGSYPYPTNSMRAWLLVNNNGVVDLNFYFSKTNKVEDLKLFDQILSTLKFTN